MKRSPFFAAAALGVAGLIVGAAITHSGSASSQGSTRTFIPLGVHASGINGATSTAWFIDANDRKVVLCAQALGGSGEPNKPVCTTAPIP